MAGRISLAAGAHPSQSRSLLFFFFFAAGFAFFLSVEGDVHSFFLFYTSSFPYDFLSEGSLFWRWSALLPLGRLQTRVARSIPRAAEIMCVHIFFKSDLFNVGTVGLGVKNPIDLMVEIFFYMTGICPGIQCSLLIDGVSLALYGGHMSWFGSKSAIDWRVWMFENVLSLNTSAGWRKAPFYRWNVSPPPPRCGEWNHPGSTHWNSRIRIHN